MAVTSSDILLLNLWQGGKEKPRNRMLSSFSMPSMSAFQTSQFSAIYMRIVASDASAIIFGLCKDAWSSLCQMAVASVQINVHLSWGWQSTFPEEKGKGKNLLKQRYWISTSFCLKGTCNGLEGEKNNKRKESCKTATVKCSKARFQKKRRVMDLMHANSLAGILVSQICRSAQLTVYRQFIDGVQLTQWVQDQ